MKPLLPALLLALIAATGCNSTSTSHGLTSLQPDNNRMQVALLAPPRVGCELPDSKQLQQAIVESQNTLTNAACLRDFERHFNALLHIGADDPASSNKLAFRDYLLFSQNAGIISKRQMQRTFTRHFSETFVSLPNNQSVCQAGKNLEQLANAMDAELNHKKLGLQQILGDNQTYYNAARQRESAVLILAATAQACAEAQL